ncbi:MAG: hypothetical protein L3J39_18985 [Verrucomicrobiales bacterium]|nr:hypothetical protein [Verrucomicrobiales bacterium]
MKNAVRAVASPRAETGGAQQSQSFPAHSFAKQSKEKPGRMKNAVRAVARLRAETGGAQQSQSFHRHFIYYKRVTRVFAINILSRKSTTGKNRGFSETLKPTPDNPDQSL